MAVALAPALVLAASPRDPALSLLEVSAHVPEGSTTTTTTPLTNERGVPHQAPTQRESQRGGVVGESIDMAAGVSGSINNCFFRAANYALARMGFSEQIDALEKAGRPVSGNGLRYALAALLFGKEEFEAAKRLFPSEQFPNGEWGDTHLIFPLSDLFQVDVRLIGWVKNGSIDVPIDWPPFKTTKRAVGQIDLYYDGRIPNGEHFDGVNEHIDTTAPKKREERAFKDAKRRLDDELVELVDLYQAIKDDGAFQASNAFEPADLQLESQDSEGMVDV